MLNTSQWFNLIERLGGAVAEWARDVQDDLVTDTADSDDEPARPQPTTAEEELSALRRQAQDRQERWAKRVKQLEADLAAVETPAESLRAVKAERAARVVLEVEPEPEAVEDPAEERGMAFVLHVEETND